MKLYNQVQDLNGNIRVYCRVRPFDQAESNKTSSVVGIDDGNITIVFPMKYVMDGNKSFTFNKVFGSSATQGGATAQSKSDLNSDQTPHSTEQRKDAFHYEIAVQIIQPAYGLLCLHIIEAVAVPPYQIEHFYVCNPIFPASGVRIPPRKEGVIWSHMKPGFAYDPATGRFKLVAPVGKEYVTSKRRWGFEIFDSGTSEWRSSADDVVFSDVDGRRMNMLTSVYAGGMLYWLVSNSMYAIATLLCFDPWVETGGSTLRPPPTEERISRWSVVESIRSTSEDRLAYLRACRGLEYVELWRLADGGGSRWEKMYKLDLKTLVARDLDFFCNRCDTMKEFFSSCDTMKLEESMKKLLDSYILAPGYYCSGDNSQFNLCFIEVYRPSARRLSTFRRMKYFCLCFDLHDRRWSIIPKELYGYLHHYRPTLFSILQSPS